MVDFHLVTQTIQSIEREDRATLESDLSACSMAGTSGGASTSMLLLPLQDVSAHKAINS